MDGYNKYLIEKNAKKKDNTSTFNSSSVYISNQSQKKGGTCLLLIDPQYDFVDGALAVPGAKDDCKRISKFILDNLDELQDIYVTMDTHMNYHIAHPQFWKDRTGAHPKPFTTISNAQIRKGEFEPTKKSPEMNKWVLHYTSELEKKGKFVLTIWPPHCLLGTQGHNIDVDVFAALKAWEEHNATMVHYILKGNNSKTEHYSAFKAEVVVPDDPATAFNEQLYKNLVAHSKIYIAGEAQSHCVNFTVRDLVDKLGEENALDKILLLENGMSSVKSYEEQGEEFVEDMKKAGLKVINISLNRKNLSLGFLPVSQRDPPIENTAGVVHDI